MNGNDNMRVYLRMKGDKRFSAVSSLKTFAYAPNLMYAVLIPYKLIEKLKLFFEDLKENTKNQCEIQVRSTKGKILHSVKINM